ncbi:hypothetical protein BKA62DRAFT_694623, partial [Auriculariales sp. MPI-PUGE-AT-0066]
MSVLINPLSAAKQSDADASKLILPALRPTRLRTRDAGNSSERSLRGCTLQMFLMTFVLLASTTMTCAARTGPVSASIVISTFWLQPASALLSHAACYRNDCVQVNREGNLCYYPSPDPDPVGHVACQNATMRALLNSHITPLSSRIPTTAHYDLASGKYIGGAALSVPQWKSSHPGSEVIICQTGLVQGDKFYTTCRRTTADEDFEAIDAQDTACGLEHGHDERVLREKCCGWPRQICPPSQDPMWRKFVGNPWTQWFTVVFAGALGLAVLAQRL